MNKYLISIASTLLLTLPISAEYKWLRSERTEDLIHLYDNEKYQGSFQYSINKFWPYMEFEKPIDLPTNFPKPPHRPIQPTKPQSTNFGIDRRAGRERWIIDGREVSATEGLKAVGSPLEDDSTVPWLVWVGDSAIGKKISEDLPKLPKFRFHSYLPNEFGACDRDGKVCYLPGLTCVSPDSHALWHLTNYTTAEELVTAIRKIDPNYRPDKVPDLNDIPDSADLTVPIASVGLLSLLGAAFLLKKPS